MGSNHRLTEAATALKAGPKLWEVILGLGIGAFGLALIAIILSILDPVLRDPAGVIFFLPG
jgi:hypothetical protein